MEATGSPAGDRRVAGFSLIETLVALLLLQAALLAFVPMFVLATRTTATAADMGTIGAAAVARMEQLRDIDFVNLTAGGSLTTDTAGYFDDSDPAFVVRWQVTDDATPPRVKTLQVRVVATRDVVSGPPREVTLSGIAAEEEDD
jgi:type II secretory pathway pseudopilin PulG